jgi:enamine deaminase RidA (YjgF/YER057c/UK114 family)
VSGEGRGARIVAPEGWPPPRGYSEGMIAHGAVFTIAGQIGWDPTTTTFATDDFAGQVEQALRNLVAVLRAGGAEPSHIVRMTWYVTSREEYSASRKAVGAAYRATVGSHYPPMSVVVVAALLDERARVEIEATAVVPTTGSQLE